MEPNDTGPGRERQNWSESHNCNGNDGRRHDRKIDRLVGKVILSKHVGGMSSSRITAFAARRLVSESDMFKFVFCTQQC